MLESRNYDQHTMALTHAISELLKNFTGNSIIAMVCCAFKKISQRSFTTIEQTLFNYEQAKRNLSMVIRKSFFFTNKAKAKSCKLESGLKIFREVFNVIFILSYR